MNGSERIPEKLRQRYEIRRHLGAGGMGSVWEAFDRQLERAVALKLLLGETEEDRLRIQRESRVLATLKHPRILEVFDAGCVDDVDYLVTDLLPLGSLQDAMAAGLFELERSRELIVQVAAALGAAHERGIIHRDIKPGNVLLASPTEAKLGDFGLARSYAGGMTITQPGFALGSIAYMSPEQTRGQGLDGRSDQFSLGVMAFELFTGTRPFDHIDGHDPLTARLACDAPRLRSLRSDCSLELDEILATALARDPERRFPRVEDFEDALRNVTLPAQAASVRSRTRLNAAPERSPQASLRTSATAVRSSRFQVAPPPPMLSRRGHWGVGLLIVGLTIALAFRQATRPVESSTREPIFAGPSTASPAEDSVEIARILGRMRELRGSYDRALQKRIDSGTIDRGNLEVEDFHDPSVTPLIEAIDLARANIPALRRTCSSLPPWLDLYWELRVLVERLVDPPDEVVKKVTVYVPKPKVMAAAYSRCRDILTSTKALLDQVEQVSAGDGAPAASGSFRIFRGLVRAHLGFITRTVHDEYVRANATSAKQWSSIPRLGGLPCAASLLEIEPLVEALDPSVATPADGMALRITLLLDARRMAIKKDRWEQILKSVPETKERGTILEALWQQTFLIVDVLQRLRDGPRFLDVDSRWKLIHLLVASTAGASPAAAQGALESISHLLEGPDMRPAPDHQSTIRDRFVTDPKAAAAGRELLVLARKSGTPAPVIQLLELVVPPPSADKPVKKSWLE